MKQSEIDSIYDKIQKAIKDWTGLRTPELPNGSINYSGSWEKMFKVWFFETKPYVSGATWSVHSDGSDLLILGKDSLYTKDLKNKSLGIPNSRKKVIAESDFKNLHVGTQLKCKFKFDGSGSATGKYGILEWYIGSFDITITVLKINTNSGTVAVRYDVDNCSSWYSATRLPEEYQMKFDSLVRKLVFWDPEITLDRLTNLVNSRPRYQVGRLLMQQYLEKFISSSSATMLLDLFEKNVAKIPSFGGTYWQHYTWEEDITFPKVVCRLKKIDYQGDNVGRQLKFSIDASDGTHQTTSFGLNLKHGESRSCNRIVLEHPMANIGALMQGNQKLRMHVDTSIIENDKYNDRGSSGADFDFDLLGGMTQSFTTQVTVQEKKPRPTNKVGVFKLTFEVERSRPIELPEKWIDPDPLH